MQTVILILEDTMSDHSIIFERTIHTVYCKCFFFLGFYLYFTFFFYMYILHAYFISSVFLDLFFKVLDLFFEVKELNPIIQVRLKVLKIEVLVFMILL